MYKHILESAGNINWMALFAMFTFMFVFLVAIWMVFMKNKKELDRIASIPLDEDEV